jgi:hypothetical protein
MRRTWALGLGAAALLATAGCSQSGSYRMSWVFVVDGTIESPATACGLHGIDSILATGTDGSDSQQVIALCVPGAFTGTAAPGTWTFSFQMLDAEVAPVRPVSPPGEPALPAVSADAPGTVSIDGPTAEFSVKLTPLPECNDGIDNDGDGRVDLADPDCGDLTGPTE